MVWFWLCWFAHKNKSKAQKNILTPIYAICFNYIKPTSSLLTENSFTPFFLYLIRFYFLPLLLVFVLIVLVLFLLVLVCHLRRQDGGNRLEWHLGEAVGCAQNGNFLSEKRSRKCQTCHLAYLNKIDCFSFFCFFSFHAFCLFCSYFLYVFFNLDVFQGAFLFCSILIFLQQGDEPGGVRPVIRAFYDHTQVCTRACTHAFAHIYTHILYISLTHSAQSKKKRIK